jgi:hypothetical protein
VYKRRAILFDRKTSIEKSVTRNLHGKFSKN